MQELKVIFAITVLIKALVHDFQKGVDPQLIKEQTGHKSDAIMRYKMSNLVMKQKVSDMLSVLPCEMEEIRQREPILLEKERVIEEKNP